MPLPGFLDSLVSTQADLSTSAAANTAALHHPACCAFVFSSFHPTHHSLTHLCPIIPIFLPHPSLTPSRSKSQLRRVAEANRQAAIARGEDMVAWEVMRRKSSSNIAKGEEVWHTCRKCGARFAKKPGTKNPRHFQGGCKGECVNYRNPMKMGLGPPCPGC